MNDRNGQERELLRAATARLRAGIMALVFGMTGGVGLSGATVWLLLRGGPNVGQHLNLLGQFLPGFRVTWAGSLVGLGYGTLLGAVIGGVLAWIYNRIADLRSR